MGLLRENTSLPLPPSQNLVSSFSSLSLSFPSCHRDGACTQPLCRSAQTEGTWAGVGRGHGWRLLCGPGAPERGGAWAGPPVCSAGHSPGGWCAGSTGLAGSPLGIKLSPWEPLTRKRPAGRAEGSAQACILPCESCSNNGRTRPPCLPGLVLRAPHPHPRVLRARGVQEVARRGRDQRASGSQTGQPQSQPPPAAPHSSEAWGAPCPSGPQFP